MNFQDILPSLLDGKKIYRIRWVGWSRHASKNQWIELGDYNALWTEAENHYELTGYDIVAEDWEIFEE